MSKKRCICPIVASITVLPYTIEVQQSKRGVSMEFSKLTLKYQATIPRDVRQCLGLHQGDVIGFRITNQQVILEKAKPIDWQFAKFTEGTLDEWNSKEDDEAFRDL